MKNIVIVLALIISSIAFGQTNKFDQLFKQMQNKKGVTTLVLNKGMFNMLDNADLKNELKEYKNLMKVVESVNLIVVEKDADNSVKTNLRNSVKGMKLEELMSLNKENNKVKLYTENSNSKSFKNLLMDISTPTETVYLMLKGNFNQADIQKSMKTISK